MGESSDFLLVGPRHEEPVGKETKGRWKRKVRSWPLKSIIIFLFIFLGCIFAPYIANHDPTAFYLDHLNQPPDGEFYFGTDSLGRDIFSVLWYGGRLSLMIGFLSAAVSSGVGIIYGCLSGTAPKWADTVLMRTAELLSSIPYLLLQLLLLGCIGDANVVSLSFVIGITTWMNLARVVRSEVRQIRKSDYVLASKIMGGKLFPCLVVPFTSQFYFPCFIYDCLFRRVIHDNGSDTEFLRNRTSYRSGIFGNDAFFIDKSPSDQFLVGHFNSRTVSYHHSCLYYPYRASPAS